MLGSKNLFSESCLEFPKIYGVHTFPDPVSYFRPPGGHLGFCRRCGVAGGGRVPPSPLGWYFIYLQLNCAISFYARYAKISSNYMEMFGLISRNVLFATLHNMVPCSYVHACSWLIMGIHKHS